MIRIYGLGTPRIEVGTHRILPSATKRFALLLFLANQAGCTAPRLSVQTLFFPGGDESAAKHALRELTYRLRKLGTPIHSDAHRLALNPDDVWHDWNELIADAVPSHELLRMAESGLLPAYAPEISEDFAEWYDGLRATLIGALTRGLLKHAVKAKLDANWRLAEHAARACLALDPFNDEAAATLAQMLALGGATTQARRVLESHANNVGKVTSESLAGMTDLRRRISKHAATSLATAPLPFAGREAELSFLTKAHTDVRLGAVRIVLIGGEPGIGKSRLLSEFASFASLEGSTVVRANAHPHDLIMPLGVAAELSRLLLNEQGALGCSPASMSWLQTLVNPQHGGHPPLSNEERSIAIAKAVIDLIHAVSSEAPLVVIVDDAQWADDVSLRLLQTVALSDNTAGVLILLCSREPDRPRLDVCSERMMGLTVGPLSNSIVSELVVGDLENSAHFNAALVNWMVDTSSGNPFFVECLLSHYHVTGESFTIPRKLNSIVDQRITALSQAGKDVLAGIVALGKHATIPRLERLLAASRANLVTAVRELEHRRLITTAEARIMPSHWLITESVQRNSETLSQRLLYRHVATILEAELASSHTSTELWACAEAWLAGDEPMRATEVIASCARRCLTLGRAREAAELYIRAATCASGERREELAKLALQISHSADEPTVTLAAFELLQNVNTDAHDDIELAVLSARIRLNLHAELTADLLAGCIRCDSASPPHRLGAAIYYLAYCDRNRLIERALSVSGALLELLALSDHGNEEAQLQCALIYHSSFGKLDVVPSICQRLLDLAATSRVDRAAGLMRKAAIGLRRCGMHRRAITVLEQCHQLAKESGLARLADAAAISLAGHYFDIGLDSESNKWMRLAESSDRSLRDDYLEFARVGVAGEIAFLRRDRSALAESMAIAERIAMKDDSVGAQRLCLALRSAVSCLDGEALANASIDRLTCHQMAGYEVGDIADFEVAIAVLSLHQRREDVQARARLATFLEEYRRPGMLYSRSLVEAAHAIGDGLDDPGPTSASSSTPRSGQ